MPTEPHRSTRNSALLKSGTLSPNPWDLTLSGQNDWPYSESTRTEDKADPETQQNTQLIQGKQTEALRPRSRDAT